MFLISIYELTTN